VVGPLRVRPDVPLSFPVEAESRFLRFPADFTIKGMFLARLLSIAPRAALGNVGERLVNPAVLKRCLPFADYPQVDYSRLAHVVAQEAYRNLAVAEAMRRLARQDIRTFAESQVGRILLALSGDATATLLKLPEMYRAALRGGSVQSTRVSAHTVQLHYRDFYGWLDCYPIGTIEGLAAHFAMSCEIEVAMETLISATYTVTLH
jgi:uncharacterized protein (TIGR02265 family)